MSAPAPTLVDEIAVIRKYIAIFEANPPMRFSEEEPPRPMVDTDLNAMRGVLNRLLAIVPEGEDAPADAGWQSIETVPPGPAQIWVFGGRHTEPKLITSDGEWWNSDYGGKMLKARPTHWRPFVIPAPPVQGRNDG